ncbi:MAG: hypothetical protein RIR83_1060 [Pseudomonadota bacterium]
MSITFSKLSPVFVGEVSPIDLRQVRGNQQFTNDDQLDFAQRFDGTLHAKTSVAVLGKNRFGNEALTDISNVNEKGEILAADDRRRASTVSNRLWHTDASFEDPAGRYSMLSARVLPPVRADTEFADMRAAHDALDEARREELQSLKVHHSIVFSRSVLGFEFSESERARLKGAVHPLIRTLPGSGRKSLYLASHAAHVVDWPVPEGRLLLRDLIEHATQREFTYCHEWQPFDFVIWDNRATMHRARPFDDKKYRRELCRTTTLDLPLPLTA